MTTTPTIPPCATDLRGRPVGDYVFDERLRLWLVKRGLDPERHQLRRPPGWATDAEHLDILREHDGYGVRLVTIDGDTYEATVDAFVRYGVDIDRGFGPQVVLPLERWTAHRHGGYQPQLFEALAR